MGINKGGRPPMLEGKKDKAALIRLTKVEFEKMEALESTYKLTRSDLIRRLVLQDHPKVVVNLSSFLDGLERISAEHGKVNNNINQLAKYVNQTKMMQPNVLKEFNGLMSQYLKYQQEINKSLKNIYSNLSK